MESEVGGSVAAGQVPAGPGASPKPPRPVHHGDPQPVRVALDDYRHWLDRECVQFGYEIFNLLQLNKVGDPESEWGKGERGTFTKWLYRQRLRGELAAARDRGLHVAKDIARYGLKSARRPGAVWLDAVNGKSRAPPATRTA